MNKEQTTSQQTGQNEMNRREFLKKSGKRLFEWGPIVSAIGATATISASLEREKLAQKNQKLSREEIFLFGEAVLGFIAFWTGWAMLDIGINRMYPPNDKK